MKMSPLAVILVAVVSSVVTAGAIELLRDSRPGPRRALAVETRGEVPRTVAEREAEPLVPATRAPARPTGLEDRLARLEQRLAALEAGSTRPRPSATPARAELPPQDDLRDLVLEWVAADREERGRAEELDEEQKQRTELEFEARFHAYMLAREHDLADWEQERLVEVFLAVEERRRKVDAGIDPLKDDPEAVEARYVEFDEWAERYEKEELGELYERISGDG